MLRYGCRFTLRGFLSHSEPRPFQRFSISEMTNSGKAALAALSPNGKYMLIAMRENGLESLREGPIPISQLARLIGT